MNIPVSLYVANPWFYNVLSLQILVTAVSWLSFHQKELLQYFHVIFSLFFLRGEASSNWLQIYLNELSFFKKIKFWIHVMEKIQKESIYPQKMKGA